jgi:SAM-dependent methyltransferase
VYDAPEALNERFDIVYVNVGALCWLPEIRGWARTVADFLEPGGFLYLYEAHPVLLTLDDQRDDGLLAIEYAYFETDAPQAFDDEYTYTDGPPIQHQRTYQWGHGLGEIITAIIDAGLGLEFVHEHREVGWRALPSLAPADTSGMWRVPERAERLPLMFSLKATKPLA